MQSDSAKQRISHGDFTGGMIDQQSCTHCGTTGSLHLDERIHELAKNIDGVDSTELLTEMLITSVRIARGRVAVSDFKLMNRALKEMLEANEVFHDFNHVRKVAVFGSARTSPDHPAYQAAVEFSRLMAEKQFMTITGAGPGIMAAGNEGAGRENSFGLNISLPFEAAANEFIANDRKLLDFNYFFTRKLSFVKEADALACFPGGFGTMDEAFESLTLIQTGKASIYPTVMVDEPGGSYWRDWDAFVRRELHRNKLISETDFSLYKVTDSVEEAVEEILNFYSNFNSYRYFGDRIVIRMEQQLTDASLEQINQEFHGLVKAGSIEQQAKDLLGQDCEQFACLPRLVFRHRRRDYGRLRELIDTINRLAPLT